MLTEYTKFRLIDKAKKNDCTMEVNWEDNKETNECKVIKFTFSDGKKAFIDKQNLYSLLFLMGTRPEQAKLVPQTITQVRHYKTTMYVQLTKDTKKGEILKVPVDISLPSVSEEVVSELKKEKHLPGDLHVKELKNSGILVPESVANKAKGR